MRLEGKVAIISGGAMGLGEAFARLFAQEGAKVVVGDIKEKQGHLVVNEINRSGGVALFVSLDVTKEEDWTRIVKETVQRFGRVNVLVNNAGIQGKAPVEDMPLETWEKVMAVNSTGVFLGTRAVVPEMKKTGSGSIVNISSNAGLVGGVNSSPYHAAKGAVRLFTKATAIECAKFGIRANSIHPGPIDTPMQAQTLADPQVTRRVIDSIPLGRVGKPEEVAYAALYMASEESSFTTGAELVIDGGQHQSSLPGR